VLIAERCASSLLASPLDSSDWVVLGLLSKNLEEKKEGNPALIKAFRLQPKEVIASYFH
jgi:cytochrome c-type biogenesis protein CcmH/NrfG